jgi:hypothetical protein
MPDLEPDQDAPPPVDIVDQIIVGFNPKLSFIGMEAALNRLSALPAKVLKSFQGASKDAFFAIAVIRYDGEKSFADLKKQLESDEHIAWVERNAPIVTTGFNDPLLAQQWALTKLGAAKPWTVAPPAVGTRTIVAIVDSGLLLLDGVNVHADLGRVEAGGGIDMDGHGTFLAGTIAAKPDNATGVASAVPYSWNISLLSLQFLSPNAPPNAADAAVAITSAADYRLDPLNHVDAMVINASWHVAPGDPGLAALWHAIAYAIDPSIGCLVVFAAGNDGTDNEVYPLYPANFGSDGAFAGSVLTVLASDRYDAKPFFSNYGKNTVHIAAPGMRILTTARYLVDPPRYAEYSGTSAAAAYVSAGAALVFALNRPNWDGAGAPGWTPQDVTLHLRESADTIEGLKLACIGGKRLKLCRAVYGPLVITAPLGGDTLSRSASNTITWTNDYVTLKLTSVRIEFSTDNFATAPTTLATGVAIGGATGSNAFTVPPNTLTVTATGQIRITPEQGNFAVVSGQFNVVA